MMTVQNRMSKMEEVSIATISADEIKKLTELYLNAQNTPMIKFTSDPNEKDLSTRAWDVVREFQKELGIKYGYDWEKHVIDQSGNVIRLTDGEMERAGIDIDDR